MNTTTKQTHLAKAAAPLFQSLLQQESYRRSLGVADTAKLVRAALRDSFPTTKFSVRSSSYSGGASIHINWTDGPTVEEVEKIAKAYEGADFDGSIDLKTYSSSWLSPDGRPTIAHDQGSEGSGGSHPEIIGDPHDPSAIEVTFGADYILTQRNFSHDTQRAALVHVLGYWAGLSELNPAPRYETKSNAYGQWIELTPDPWLPGHSCHVSCLIHRHLYKVSLA